MAKLLGYSFRVEWIPGKSHMIVDALLEKPIIIRHVTEGIEDEALEGIAIIAEAEGDYQEVVTTIRKVTYEGKKIKKPPQITSC